MSFGEEDKVRAVHAKYSDVVDMLPLSHHSEDLGTSELPALSMVITDAQGNRIRTNCRDLMLDFQKADGRVAQVRIQQCSEVYLSRCLLLESSGELDGESNLKMLIQHSGREDK